ncbi:hypothetical protein MF672_040370 [Actinomadura sp. ATCC 31491]|uniref:Uncharacterized protein n=1 Tax=Actinomadura luzonensis TaxID=2805427 RepID=A0ABT0G5W6_9ACTN|nr:hypothetical protein [Actinomadura luzonensis]MCK2220009.1 hypothetical protein [Actinomadura luzonensis]
MRAFLRFLLADPAGWPADGRMLGLGLSTALRKHHSADDAERYLRRWAAEHDVHRSPRH